MRLQKRGEFVVDSYRKKWTPDMGLRELSPPKKTLLGSIHRYLRRLFRRVLFSVGNSVSAVPQDRLRRACISGLALGLATGFIAALGASG